MRWGVAVILALAFVGSTKASLVQPCGLYGDQSVGPRDRIDNLFQCLFSLNIKIRQGNLHGIDPAKTFLVQFLGTLSNNDGAGLFYKYVQAVQEAFRLDIPLSETFFLQFLPVYNDYLKYQRLDGFTCQSYGGDRTGFKCSYSSATTLKLGVIAQILITLSLYMF